MACKYLSKEKCIRDEYIYDIEAEIRTIELNGNMRECACCGYRPKWMKKAFEVFISEEKNREEARKAEYKWAKEHEERRYLEDIKQMVKSDQVLTEEDKEQLLKMKSGPDMERMYYKIADKRREEEIKNKCIEQKIPIDSLTDEFLTKLTYDIEKIKLKKNTNGQYNLTSTGFIDSFTESNEVIPGFTMSNLVGLIKTKTNLNRKIRDIIFKTILKRASRENQVRENQVRENQDVIWE
jgi:hypothetical protein